MPAKTKNNIMFCQTNPILFINVGTHLSGVGVLLCLLKHPNVENYFQTANIHFSDKTFMRVEQRTQRNHYM